MDGELLVAPSPQMIDVESTKIDSPEVGTRKHGPAKKWFQQWVSQDTVLNPGKCQVLKWVNEETMRMINHKRLEVQDDSEYEAVYVCTFDNCGKVFTEASALRKHAHVHGEKQYICHYEGCGKRFVDSSKLKRHFLIHTGEKQFSCNLCGKAFSLDFNLRSHMRTHTGENYHTCPYKDCGKRYAHEYKLRGHLKAHHNKVLPDGKPVNFEPEAKSSGGAASGGRPFACPYEGCDKRYHYEYKLNLHLKTARHAIEDLVQNGATVSDEYSEGSENRGKSRMMAPKAPASKKRKAAAAAAAPKVLPFKQPPPAVEKRLDKSKVCRSSKQDDSEETEDENGRDDAMDEDGPIVFEMDEEETEDDMD